MEDLNENNEENDDISYQDSDLEEIVVQKRSNNHKDSEKNLLLKIKTKYNKQPHLSKIQNRTIDKYLLVFAGHFTKKLQSLESELE